jgi:hypothetical protein
VISNDDVYQTEKIDAGKVIGELAIAVVEVQKYPQEFSKSYHKIITNHCRLLGIEKPPMYNVKYAAKSCESLSRIMTRIFT